MDDDTSKPKPKVPDALLETRPGLAERFDVTHPNVTPYVPPTPRGYSKGLHDRIVELVRDRYRDPGQAALECGITSNTWTMWTRMAREGHVILRPLFEDIEAAMAAQEGKALDTWMSPETRDAPLNAEKFLEKTRPRRYAKDVQLKVNAMLMEAMQKLREGLLPHEYIKVVAILSGQSHELSTVSDAKLLTETNDDNGGEEES